jgi:mxaC protein
LAVSVVNVTFPWVLVLLPLVAIPLLWDGRAELRYSWLALVPRDAASTLLAWALRTAGALALAALVLGLAGTYRPAMQVERIGRGAEIILVLDRSRSMDQAFVSAETKKALPEGYRDGRNMLDDNMSYNRFDSRRESKGRIARKLLSEFTASRKEDRFGMIMFSTLPIRVLDFTQKQEAIQAAVTAGDIGRGLSETDIGLALEDALSYFDDRPYTGSRLIMLVSDGGDHIDPDARTRITDLMRKHRVALYWIYIRSYRSPGLMAESDEAPENADTVPEYFLHKFFQGMGTPYRAYEAENPLALQRAIADVNRLENLPITYFDTLPRQDLSQYFFGLALVLTLFLLAAKIVEVKTWQ